MDGFTEEIGRASLFAAATITTSSIADDVVVFVVVTFCGFLDDDVEKFILRVTGGLEERRKVTVGVLEAMGARAALGHSEL